jgi:hypothetical protein
LKKAAQKVWVLATQWAKTPTGKKIEAAVFKAVVALVAAKLGLDLSQGHP